MVSFPKIVLYTSLISNLLAIPVSDVLVDSLILQGLYLHFNRTLVEVGEQCLCVANKEVELLRREFLQHQGTHHQHVPSPLYHNLIG